MASGNLLISLVLIYLKTASWVLCIKFLPRESFDVAQYLVSREEYEVKVIPGNNAWSTFLTVTDWRLGLMKCEHV